MSLILQTATRLLMPLMLMFSVFLLLRGHNEPGGGFVGGLVTAAAFALYTIAYDPRSTFRTIGITPQTLIGLGLIVAILSGTVSLFRGQPLMTSQWIYLRWGELELEVGTPLVFDFGVYLVVVGVVLTIVVSLAEQ